MAVGALLLVVLGGVTPPASAPEPAAVVAGQATWLCDPPRFTRCTAGYPEGSMVAAAGSELQRGSWRGSWVTVRHGGRDVTVQLVDSCACAGRRIIDLYAVAFRKLAPTSAGVISVTVESAGAPGPRVTLPPTDTP